MAQDFKSSFIPKEPVIKRGGAIRRENGINIIGLIVWILFGLVVLLAIGSFLYKILLANSLESKKQTLSEERERFDPALIDELVRLEERIEAGERLLDSHVAISNVFSALESLTSQSVRFQTFSYGSGTAEEGGPVLSLSGIGTDFNAVAYQSDVLGRSRLFRNIIFSGLEVTPEDFVEFSVTSTVDPKLVLYEAGDGDENQEQEVNNTEAQ